MFIFIIIKCISKIIVKDFLLQYLHFIGIRNNIILK